MRELITTLTRADRIFFDFHIATGVPFPFHAPVRSYLVDEIAIHAIVGMARVGKATRNTSFDLKRDDFPAKKYRVSIGQAPEIVMLADVTMLPHHLAGPVVFPQQPAASAHVLRTFSELA